MNRHLNLFKFFNQEQVTEHIENNLTRALVLNLRHNALFFHEFIKNILMETDSKEDYDYLFSNFSENDRAEIDIQVNVTSLNETEFRRIYAIATTPEDLVMKNFFNYTCEWENYQPVTDIVITIKDIIFVFEVKRWNEDCRQQLYNQIYKLTMQDDKSSKAKQALDQNVIIPYSFKWQQIMSLVIRVNNFSEMVNKQDIFLKDFIELVQRFNINWLPVTPFSNISENVSMDVKRTQRLLAAISQTTSLKSLDAAGRSGFEIDFGWAKEILPWFGRDKQGNLTLNVHIWPGNTKGQGWKVFYSPKVENIYNNTEIVINGKPFRVKVENEIKFSHFNKYITELDFKESDTIKELITTKNFENYAGKHTRDSWPKLESFFDRHFKPEFNWRERCKWNNNFVNTNRNYLTLAIGYEISTIIPYEYLKEIDKDENNFENLSNVFKQIHDFYRNLL